MRLDERIFLLKTIQSLRRKNLTYNEILKELEFRRILPENWDASKIRKFVSRYKNLVIKERPQINPNIEIFEFIKPMIKNIEITDQDKFELYFKGLTNFGKSQFFDWLSVPYLHKDIHISDVCNSITKDFEKLGLLNEVTIRMYMPNKFKNPDMQTRKLGKTFQVTGRKQKGAI